MALASLEPVYKKWISDITPDNIYDKLVQVQTNFNDIIKDILYRDIKDEVIDINVVDARKKLLYITLSRNLFINSGKIIKNKNKVDDILKELHNDIKTINLYEKRDILLSQKQTLDVLTLISLIFLPLTFITGYFGMNFASMGNPAEKHGILSIKYGQVLVFILFIFTVFLTILLVKRYYRFSI